LTLGGLLLLTTGSLAHPSGNGPRGGVASTPEAMAAKVLALDANGDGKLTKEEVTDERLHSLFNRADANQDDVVTRAELIAQIKKESAAAVAAGSQRGGGPGGRGGPGGGGPPQPGQIISPFVQEALQLTAAQRERLADLQKLVDAKLAEILTDAQKEQISEMRNRGPGGPCSGPGGRSGSEGRGNPPARPPGESN